MLHLPDIQVLPLRRAKTAQAYALYKAGLEWSLADPIGTADGNDIQSTPTWCDRVAPYHHQVANLITFCRRLPAALIADDVGLGKTISAGLIASELIARQRISRLLVVAPKLLGAQWKSELEAKFAIPTRVAIGRDLLRSEYADDHGAVITTYASARLYIDRLPRDHFQLLVLDEAHKLRNLHGVPTPPLVARRVRDALAARFFRYVLMLTATPLQNRLWDLYSLLDLLAVARGHANPLGPPGLFVRRYVADGAGEGRKLKPEARDQFRATVAGYMSRTRRGDAGLAFPQRIVRLERVPPTPAEQHLIRMLAQPIRALTNRLAQISILQALSSSPDALAAQLATMARNGTILPEVANPIRAVIGSMGPTAKLRALAALAEELRASDPKSWRMVVFTHRRETQTTIQAYFEDRQIPVAIVNGDGGHRNQDAIAWFTQTPPDTHVLVSTETGAEGINLQAANVVVNFDLPWNPMVVEQRIGRVQRLTSPFAKVLVYNLVLSGTFEEIIVARLLSKLQMAADAIGDLEALLEASGLGHADDTIGFEEHVRRLVLASLEGADVDEALHMAEASIDQARIVLAEHRTTLDDAFGQKNENPPTLPLTPRLPPTTRSMTSEQFQHLALATVGADTPADRIDNVFRLRNFIIIRRQTEMSPRLE